MRKIIRLDMVSTLKLFAVFYSVIGFYVVGKAVLTGADSFQLPFGFAYPLCTFYLYLTVHLSSPGWTTMGFVLMGVVFYAITGLISGTAVVLVYNLVARYAPLLLGEFEPERRLTTTDKMSPISSHPASAETLDIAPGNHSPML